MRVQLDPLRSCCDGHDRSCAPCSALVQTSDIPHVDVLNQPKLGFTARDASWEATSDTANAWLQLARDGRLGKLWPRVVHTATRRHIFAGLSHFLYAVCGVVSAVVLLTGVQRGIANYNTDPNALSYLIIYAFALFVSDLLRILLNSHTRIESRRACESWNVVCALAACDDTQCRR